MASELLEAIEREIDANGLDSVLGLVAEVCHLKAAHIRENWQDEALARDWESRGKVIERAAFKVA